MRILNIEIENIASLKGKHKIDFNSFQHEGLFAITGVTGSGKSTILNCISLALYGSHYKSQISQSDVVSLGEISGAIKLHFRVKNIDYLALWQASILKKDLSPLKTPRIKRDFFQVKNNEHIPLTVSPEDIIGLNFNQFCKTIILNQGEFSRFITANFKERKELLERLTEDFKIKEISQLLNNDIKELAQKIEILQTTKITLTSMNKEKLVLAQTQLEALKILESHELKIFSLLEKLEQYCNKLIELDQQSQRISKQKDQKTQDLISLTEQRNQLNAKLQKINKKHQSASDFLEANLEKLERIAIRENEIQNLEDKLGNSQNTLSQLYQDYQELEISNGLQKSRNQTLTAELDDLQRSNKWLIGFDQDKFEKVFKSFFNEMQKLENIQIQRQHTENQYEQVSKKIIQLKELDDTIFLKQEALLNDQIFKINENIQKHQDYLHKKKTFQERVQEANQQIQQYLKENTTISEEIQLLRDQLRHEVQKKEEVFIAELTEISIKKKQCQVCGSENIQHLHTKRIENNHYDDQKYRIKIAKLETTQNQINERQALLREEIKVLQKEFEKEYPPIQFQTKDNDHLRLEKLSKSLTEAQNERQTLQRKVTEIQYNVKLSKSLTDEAEHLKNNLHILTEQINLSKKYCDSTKDQLHKIRPDLESYQYEQFTLTRDIYQHYLQVERDLQTNTNSLSQAEKQINKVQEQINAYIKTKDSLSKKIEASRLVVQQANLSCSANEELKRLQEQQRIIERERNETQNIFHQRNLEYQVQREKISHLSEIITEIEYQRANIVEKIKILISKSLESPNLICPWPQKTNTLNKITKDATLKPNQLMIDIDLFNREFIETTGLNISEWKTNQTIVHKTLQKEIIENETILKKERENYHTALEVEKQLESLNREINDLQTLKDIFGKDEFRNYVLAKVESQLIEYANRELKQMCLSRFSIYHNLNNHLATEYYIIDRAFDGQMRKLSTLSGGETFMVSLAMAMALSEMSRGQTEIESFFIDEGFGSLDEQSLDEVYEALTQIQARGKQLGIISHVKSLTSRIPININIIKKETGSSSLEVCFQ